MEDKYYSRLVKMSIYLIDIFCIQIAFSLVRQMNISQGISDLKYTSFFVIFSLIWVIAGFLNEIQRINKFSLIRNIGRTLFSTVLVHFVILMSIILFFPPYHFSAKFVTMLYAFTIFLITGVRVIYKVTWKYFEFSGFDQRKVIIIGATRSGKALHEFFVSHDYTRYHFKGFFDNHPERSFVKKDLIVGTISEVENYCIKENISEIYFALPLRYETLIHNLSKFADDNFIYLRIVPDFCNAVSDRYNVFLFDTVPVFTPRNEPLGISINAGIKRLFDIGFSLGVILLIFPFIVPIIAIAIRLDSTGPVIFKQLRRGKKDILFECYKFRTMRVNSQPDKQATKDDPRITRVGKFLRKTNLDELPQFVNVLLGNMSVVGPRPHISNQDEYSRFIKKYRFRRFVTPGITGYAQVNGFRGETKEPSQMEKRVEYDVKYMENWSLALDIKIIWLTIWNMFRGQKNAY